MDDNVEITYEDEWFKLDDDGNRIPIDDYGNEIMDEAKVINFKDEYIKNKLIGAKPKEKKIQKEFIEYLYGIIALNGFTKNSLKELKETLSNLNKKFVQNHREYFFENKDSFKTKIRMVGLLRAIGLDFLSELERRNQNVIEISGEDLPAVSVNNFPVHTEPILDDERERKKRKLKNKYLKYKLKYLNLLNNQ